MALRLLHIQAMNPKIHLSLFILILLVSSCSTEIATQGDRIITTPTPTPTITQNETHQIKIMLNDNVEQCDPINNYCYIPQNGNDYKIYLAISGTYNPSNAHEINSHLLQYNIPYDYQNGDVYAVSIIHGYEYEYCTVANGSGIISNQDIVVYVDCFIPSY